MLTPTEVAAGAFAAMQATDADFSGGLQYAGIEPYDKQLRFIDALEHHVAFVGGIGSGKTWAGCIRALRAAAYGVIGDETIQTPNLGVITAPTYRMLKDATIRAFLDLAGERVRRFNRSEMLAELDNGSEIIFRSTDQPNNLRGPSISWWFGDEAALYNGVAFNIMIGRMRQFGQYGYAWLATTPKGRNWLWKVFVQNTDDDYLLIKATSRENVHLDERVLSSWESAYVGDFKSQELEAEFVAFEGLIYPDFQHELHVTTGAGDDYEMYIAGVDWGYANPGVILIFGVDGDGRATLVREEYQRGIRVEEWASIAGQLQATYKATAWYCDPSEPDFIQQFVDKSVPAYPAINDVLPGIQAVKARLARQGDGRPRLVISSSAVYTISEFESYVWMAHSRDGVQDRPRKANDHAMDALRYAVMGLQSETIVEAQINYGDDYRFSESAY